MSWLQEFESDTIIQGTIVDNLPWRVDPLPLGIVLSNPCDLQHGKASYVLAAALIPAGTTIKLSEEFKQRVAGADGQKLSKTKYTNLEKFLEQFVNNKNITRYFFVDPTPLNIGLPLLFIDFQHLITIPFDEVRKLETVAQMPTPFKEKMIVHFTSYLSRIGVERENPERIKGLTADLANPYFAAGNA